MARLAVVTTHPIQYNAPLFARLSGMDGIHTRVFYTWSQTAEGGQYDPDFGRKVEWDIPLREGYEHVFLENTARRPGSDRFRGIVNPGLIEALEAWRPDAILVFTWAHQSHLAALRHFKGRVPILFRGDSTLIDESPGLKMLLRRLLLRWVYRHVDMALFAGLRNRAYFVAHGVGETRLCRCPHAIDNGRFMHPPGDADRQAREWRRSLGIDEDRVVVLFCGKLEPKKDPACLTRIAALARSERLIFAFAGDGRLKPDLSDAVTGDDRFRFLGFQNQQAMPVVYRMSDIMILPSLYGETWGLAVNEAMACGRPVIVSDRVGCAPDLVEDGRTGWVFQPGPAGEARIAGILEQCASGRIDLSGMGREGRDRIAAFSIEAAAEGVAIALQRLGKR